MKPRLRFAPSPTGFVHIGGLRTALYNYLYAKKNEGTYLLRVEDTDQSRYVEGAIEGMIQAMEWAGVNHDEGPFIEKGTHQVIERGEFGPYIQSKRLDLYKEHADQLIESGHAYYCFCSKERLDQVREKQKSEGLTPKYDGHCRHLNKDEVEEKLKNNVPHVVRLKLPESRVIEFDDAIKGPISVSTDDLDDQVLMKTDGFPTYHMAVVVDDHYMGITHVVRGDEWLISTPKHIYTYEAFGWEPPQFVHLPVILSQSKKKLSKREGDVSVEDFKKKGYLPEALVNYIALVGWSPEDGTEIMDMQTLIEKFSFERVSKSSGVFDVDKLNWMNNQYIRKHDLLDLTELAKDFFIEAGFAEDSDAFNENKEHFSIILDILSERLNKLNEIKDYYALFNDNEIVLEDQEAKEMIEMEHVGAMLQVFADKISLREHLTAEEVKLILKEVQKETGHKGKNLFMPVRVALTGQVHGPDIARVMEVIGPDNTFNRIMYSIEHYCVG